MLVQASWFQHPRSRVLFGTDTNNVVRPVDEASEEHTAASCASDVSHTFSRISRFGYVR